jgi:hypothetical protein
MNVQKIYRWISSLKAIANDERAPKGERDAALGRLDHLYVILTDAGVGIPDESFQATQRPYEPEEIEINVKLEDFIEDFLRGYGRDKKRFHLNIDRFRRYVAWGVSPDGTALIRNDKWQPRGYVSFLEFFTTRHLKEAEHVVESYLNALERACKHRAETRALESVGSGHIIAMYASKANDSELNRARVLTDLKLRGIRAESARRKKGSTVLELDLSIDALELPDGST